MTKPVNPALVFLGSLILPSASTIHQLISTEEHIAILEISTISFLPRNVYFMTSPACFNLTIEAMDILILAFWNWDCFDFLYNYLARNTGHTVLRFHNLMPSVERTPTQSESHLHSHALGEKWLCLWIIIPLYFLTKAAKSRRCSWIFPPILVHFLLGLEAEKKEGMKEWCLNSGRLQPSQSWCGLNQGRVVTTDKNSWGWAVQTECQ